MTVFIKADGLTVASWCTTLIRDHCQQNSPGKEERQLVRPDAGSQACRKQFGGPLARNHLVQRTADIVIEVTPGLHACLHLGCIKNKGTVPRVTGGSGEGQCVTVCVPTGNVLGMTKDAQNVLRGNRICYKFHMIQQLMNLEAINTYKSTHDIHALILSRAITGILCPG
ncbi:LOW QUALITY PROTEIN: glutaryl-CoA dehydrogenase-like [Geothlypis trichas]